MYFLNFKNLITIFNFHNSINHHYLKKIYYFLLIKLLKNFHLIINQIHNHLQFKIIMLVDISNLFQILNHLTNLNFNNQWANEFFIFSFLYFINQSVNFNFLIK